VCATIETALLDAFSAGNHRQRPQSLVFPPTVEDYGGRLTAGGFQIHYMRHPRPDTVPGDVTGWLETFAESFTSLPAADQRPLH